MHRRMLALPKSKAKASVMTLSGNACVPSTRHAMLLAFMLILSVSAWALFTGAFDLCKSHVRDPLPESTLPNGLEFLAGKQVVLVSHELTLTGGPLLLMELAVLLAKAGAQVKWVTNQRSADKSNTFQSLEAKLIKSSIQVLPARGSFMLQSVREADLIVLNTAVAGKWLDSAIKDELPSVLPKILWWIHEMRGHYFNLEYVKHLPNVGGAMIDSFATAEYWKNRTQERLRIDMPPTYVVHLGNSRELTEVSEDALARRLLREHVREGLGLSEDDIVFAIINSVSRGKGQDLFLKSFYEALQTLETTSMEPRRNLHALVVGCDMSIGKYELELRSFVKEKKIEHLVHFVNKTMHVIPYLTAIDVLVQNSQARGECFGRITIEAMAFDVPVLGTAAGGTMEIVLNGTSGLLHPVGKEGVPILANHMLYIVADASRRSEMGKKGHQRVREKFMERHMSGRIGRVLQEVLANAKRHQKSI